MKHVFLSNIRHLHNSSGLFIYFFLLPLQKELLTNPEQTEGQETPTTTLQTAFYAFRAEADHQHLACPDTSH